MVILHFFNALEKFTQSIAKVLLLFTVILVLILSSLSIIFRWTEQTNMWVDPLNRHLIFLVIFLGATLAVKSKKHLKLDILTPILEHKLSTKWKHFIDSLVHFASFIICLVLLKSCYQFWISEKEYPQEVFLGIQNYHLVGLIPAGMILLSFAFFIRSITLWGEK